MTEPAPVVLVIDDEVQIRRFLRAGLELDGFIVQDAETGTDALKSVTLKQPDLVILDLGLPDMDGSDVLERLRAWSSVPLIVLSVRSNEAEKVRLLESGADDYVVKPFGRQELVARVEALLRRTSSEASERQDTYSDARVTIDFAQRSVTFDGREVSLTPLEFKLLSAFVRNPRQVLSRDQLLELVWGSSYGVSGDQVKLYVGYLRKKLDPDDPASVPIETVRGFGYRYRSE
jgi:two-component system, OmpR family, KDP operon response regulator KdpE